MPTYLHTPMQVALWPKPQSLGLADQKVGGSNPRDGVSFRGSVPALAKLAVRKHVKVQVDKEVLLSHEGKRCFRALWFPSWCSVAPEAV